MIQSNTYWLRRTGLIAVIAVSLATGAEAARDGYSGGGGQVVAHSHFGNGAVVGSVRQSRRGLQVRTPGGNWLYCERSCSETLRVNTVDFWQSEKGAGNAATTREDGLLSRWLQWGR